MKQPVRALCFILLVSACSAGPTVSTDAGVDAGTQAPAAVPVRVMTWNVRQLGADGGTPNRVAALITAQQPDLVTVQEVTSTQTYDALAALLADAGFAGHAGVLAASSGDLLQAVFWRTAKLSVTQPQNLFTSDPVTFPRPPLTWRTEVTGRATGFNVLAVHLKAGIGNVNEQTRIDALKAIDSSLLTVIDAGTPDWLVLGDFNEATTDPRSAEAFASFEPAVFTALTPGLADAGVYTFLPRMLLLDHVVATRSLDGARDGGLPRAPRLDVSESDYATVSDHLPLLLDLTF